MSRRARSVATLVTLAATAGCASARPSTAPAPGSILNERVHAVNEDLLGSAAYDLPVEANNWVEAELNFLVLQRSSAVRNWMRRGEYYGEFINSVLRSHGLPGDLVYMAMIESGLVPTARSRAGAVGWWQFMPATGRAMGLRIDDTVDERMDPVRSTRAAARLLLDLYGDLGRWPLALAAYNAGEGRISRAMAKFRADNFWDLAERGDLARETRLYVPRLYAMTVIGHDPRRFGFAPPLGGPSFAYDSVQVEYATPLTVLARLGDVTLEQLDALNPHLLDRVTPAGGYWVWVPPGSGVALQRAYLTSDFRKRQREREAASAAHSSGVAALLGTSSASSSATPTTLPSPNSTR